MQALKGFRDFFPEEMAERNYLFETWRRVARRFGFAEFDGPPLEYLELYVQKSGGEIVGQLYSFEDQGGREVALRPEMTPTLGRMMAARGSQLPKPVKWFSIPQLFRQEKNQRGRLREHFQLNVDIVGAREVQADVELLSVAIEIMRELGLTPQDVVARVNDRRVVAGALKALGLDSARTPAVYSAIDKFRKVPEDAFRQVLAEAGVPAAALDEIVGLCQGTTPVVDWFKERENELDEAAANAVRDLARYLELLEESELGEFVEVDFSIVRGLAYYTGIVFELFDRAGKERAICGGGRYDDLVKALGGPDLPALGFGMGDVVLGLMLRDRGLMPQAPPRADVVVIPVGTELQSAARTVARRLRESDLRVELPFRSTGVGKDLKAADQQSIPLAAIVGPDEWANESVNLKELRTGEQETVRLDELADRIRGALSRPGPARS